MKTRIKQITHNANMLAGKANEWFEMMENEHEDFAVINVQMIQLNTCVTMIIAYYY